MSPDADFFLGLLIIRISDAPACTPNGVERECVFPFKYQGVTYDQCTKKNHDRLWCSTMTDANGNSLINEWGNCGHCQGAFHLLGIIIEH